MAFQKEFLDAIVSFNSTNEFLPVYFYNGKIVTVCSFRVKGDKGTIGLNIEFTPENTDMQEGDVFYIKEPAKLKKTIALVPSELLPLKITKSQLISKGEGYQFRTRLYDPMLASRNTTFWKPEKFEKIRETIVDGVRLSKELVTKIKTINPTISDDIAYVTSNEEDKTTLCIGESDFDSFELEIPFDGCFSEKSAFNKHLFSVLGRNEVSFSETSDKRIMVVTDETEHTRKYCIITKIPLDSTSKSR